VSDNAKTLAASVTDVGVGGLWLYFLLWFGFVVCPFDIDGEDDGKQTKADEE
jgi:hypothetical protein